MRLLYVYGEEITGRRAREIHTFNRVCSLAEVGVEVVLVHASGKLTGPEFLASRSQKVPSGLTFQSFPREWKLGGFGLKSSGHFYQQVQKWLILQPRFDACYGIHLKAVLALKKKNPLLPIVFEAHEVFADAYHARSVKGLSLSLQEQSAYRLSDALVCTSLYLEKELQKRYSIPAKRFISPNCSEEFFFDCELGRSQPKQILYLGSFQKWKGVDVAIQAMKMLPDFSLSIVEGAPMKFKS